MALCSHPPCRFAQVVMWLESLASQKLPQDPVQLAASFRFGSQEGVWKDTLRGLGGGHSRQGLADTELDPDAVSRDQLKLARGDQQNEQRLANWVWRLVRAGEAAARWSLGVVCMLSSVCGSMQQLQQRIPHSLLTCDTRAALIVWLWLSCRRVIGTRPAHCRPLQGGV